MGGERERKREREIEDRVREIEKEREIKTHVKCNDAIRSSCLNYVPTSKDQRFSPSKLIVNAKLSPPAVSRASRTPPYRPRGINNFSVAVHSVWLQKFISLPRKAL